MPNMHVGNTYTYILLPSINIDIIYLSIYLSIYLFMWAFALMKQLYKSLTSIIVNVSTKIWIHNINPHMFSSTASSSSSCHAASTDIPDPLSPSVCIVHCSPGGTARYNLYHRAVVDSWSFNVCSSMFRDPLKYITYEIVLTPPAVSRMSGLSNLDSFRDRL